MKVYTPASVQKKIQEFTDGYRTYREAAEAIGCTETQLSMCRRGKILPPPSVLKAIGLERLPIYVSHVEEKYRVDP